MPTQEDSRKAIVTIEDEPSISDLLNHVLDAPQLDVTHCSDGAEGLDAVRRLRPDLVIMDVMMPEMDGCQVYDAIRNEDDIKATPVLVLSVTGQEFERSRAFRVVPLISL